MADPTGISGSPLGDLFAGAAGANINRPALNAFVANSQAMNGLRSAQTQDALIKAQQAQEETEAHGRLFDELTQSGLKPSDAMLTRDMLISHFGDAQTALKAVGTLKLGYGSPEDQTSGQQMVQGKVATPIQVPNEYTTLPGAFQPNVQQTPLGAAQTGAQTALAGLNTAKANAGGFNPHTGAAGGPIDPNMVNFGGYMLYHTGKMPAMGMGGGAARAAIIANAAQLAQQEQAQPGSTTNPGFDQAISNGQDFTAAGRALGSFAGGPLGNSTRSLNNGVGHLQLMDNLFKALQNGDIQGANKLGNLWAKQFGSPAPTNVQAASEVLGPELMKILSNNSGAGTVDERQGFANTVGNLANAPEQTSGAISTLRGMLGRQAADMALQYHGATQRNDFASRYLQPDVAQYLDLSPQTSQQTTGPGAAPTSSLGSQVPTPSSGASAKPVQIQNDDDYNKLPSGILFIGPDGHTRTKP